MDLPSYEKNNYVLDNGEELHEQYPDSFYIPERAVRDNLKADDLVKLIFNMEEKDNSENFVVERMWVIIIKKVGKFYVGKLDNDPQANVFISCDDIVNFKSEHVIQIYEE